MSCSGERHVSPAVGSDPCRASRPKVKHEGEHCNASRCSNRDIQQQTQSENQIKECIEHIARPVRRVYMAFAPVSPPSLAWPTNVFAATLPLIHIAASLWRSAGHTRASSNKMFRHPPTKTPEHHRAMASVTHLSPSPPCKPAEAVVRGEVPDVPPHGKPDLLRNASCHEPKAIIALPPHLNAVKKHGSSNRNTRCQFAASVECFSSGEVTTPKDADLLSSLLALTCQWGMLSLRLANGSKPGCASECPSLQELVARARACARRVCKGDGGAQGPTARAQPSAQDGLTPT